MPLHDLQEALDELLSGPFLIEAQDFQRRRAGIRLLLEQEDDRQALEAQSRRYVHGTERTRAAFDGDSTSLSIDDTAEGLLMGGQQVMQPWEHPLMEAMVELMRTRYTRQWGVYPHRVLEVGFGMGISATLIQKTGAPAEHVIIECNPAVMQRAQIWAKMAPGKVTLLPHLWEQVLPSLTPQSFAGILFDPYTTTWEATARYDRSEPYSHMVEAWPHLATLLAPRGRLTYFTAEVDSLGRNHQRALLQHFGAFEVRMVRHLQPPDDCNYWWSDTMAVIAAWHD